MPCKPTRFPNGIEVGNCLHLVDGATVVTGDVIVEITSADSPYQMTGDEDVLACHVTGGAIDVTYVDKGDAIKKHNIRAIGGTVNFFSNAATIETNLITDGQAVVAFYSQISDAWLDL